MLVPWEDLNGHQPNTIQFKKGAEQKRCRLGPEDLRENTGQDLWAYGCTLDLVPSFKYLGRIIMASDNDYPVVVINLWKAQNKWDRLTRILGREGANPRLSGNFFKALVHKVLIFGL